MLHDRRHGAFRHGVGEASLQRSGDDGKRNRDAFAARYAEQPLQRSAITVAIIVAPP